MQNAIKIAEAISNINQLGYTVQDVTATDSGMVLAIHADEEGQICELQISESRIADSTGTELGEWAAAEIDAAAE